MEWMHYWVLLGQAAIALLIMALPVGFFVVVVTSSFLSAFRRERVSPKLSGSSITYTQNIASVPHSEDTAHRVFRTRAGNTEEA